MQIIKRDGSKQDFNQDKIKVAIQKAFLDTPSEGLKVDEKELNRLTSIITGFITLEGINNVEDIQDAVEYSLMQQGYFDTARAYIKYRHEHKLARDKYSTLMQAVKAKLEAKNVENSNANLDENTFSGREKEAFGTPL